MEWTVKFIIETIQFISVPAYYQHARVYLGNIETEVYGIGAWKSNNLQAYCTQRTARNYSARDAVLELAGK